MHKSFSAKLLSLNWSLISLIIIISSIGFAMLYSAAEGNIDPWAYKQIIRFTALFPIMLLIAIIDIRIWFKLSYFIYFLAIMMLVMVMTEEFGIKAMGATRWIRFGSINIQPSEISKICVVFALAHYFHSTSQANIEKIPYLIIPLIIVLLPAFLVMKQPDLGTAIIIIMVGGSLFFVGGVKIWKFLVVIIGSIIAIPFFWQHLHDYQKNRILAFLDPEGDPLGNGYNIMQSKIAIGSGGFSGKGFLNGSQSQLSFLPEKQTDFIFTMLSEEFGFVGGIILILLYTIIIAYGTFIALISRSHFGKMMAIGITEIFFLHIFINIAMVMGMIPIVGAPLPLLSYGGTIMVTMLISFGLLLNIHLYGDKKLYEDSKTMRIK